MSWARDRLAKRAATVIEYFILRRLIDWGVRVEEDGSRCLLDANESSMCRARRTRAGGGGRYKI